jgi:hypothetical protein
MCDPFILYIQDVVLIFNAVRTREKKLIHGHSNMICKIIENFNILYEKMHKIHQSLLRISCCVYFSTFIPSEVICSRLHPKKKHRTSYFLVDPRRPCQKHR